MKNFYTFALFTSLLLLLCGCGNRMDSEKCVLTIYRMPREVYNTFMTAPTKTGLTTEGVEHTAFNRAGMYIRYGGSQFPIRQKLIRFVSDPFQIQQFMEKEGINTTVKNTALIEVANMPLFLWVETMEGSVYITVNENPDEALYTYRLYTAQEFEQKHKPISGALCVHEEIVYSKIAPVLYGEYADVSFVDILESLGAQITLADNNGIIITTDQGQYLLDAKNNKLVCLENGTSNLFYQLDGGVLFVYTKENVCMVDSYTAEMVLQELGYDVQIRCDRNTKTVTVSKKQTDY